MQVAPQTDWKLTFLQCFMYSSESLKVLANIANSEKLRSYLRQIYFITALIKERPKHCPHHCLGHCWHPTVRQQEAFTIYLRDQQALRQDKRAKLLLTDAFSKLPRLTSLSLVDNTLEVPLSAEVRGLSKFQRTTGTIPHYAPSEAAAQPALLEHFAWQSYCWRNLIVAIAESGIKTLKKVETKMRSHVHGISPIDDLKFKTSTMDKLRVAFADLETFSVQFRSYAMRKDKPERNGSVSRARKGLEEFAPILSNVTDFGVSFDLADQNGVMCKSLMGKALDLSKLKKVKLDSIAIDNKTLGTILASLTSVEKITLHAIDLTSGNWVTILKVLKQLPQLQHLHLVYLQQSRQKVYFLKQLDEEEDLHDAAWGMPPGPDDLDDDDWSEDHDDDEDDEDLPDLIPQEELNDSIPDLVEPDSVGEKSVPTVEPEVVKKCAMYEDKDYKAPGQERMPERGYFICLPSRDEIEKKLPLFIEECNVGNDIMEDDMGGLAGLNGLLQALGGPGGAPIVMPAVGMVPPPQAGHAQQPAPPPPPGGNAAQGGAGGQGGANAITAALNQILAGGPPAHGGHMQFTIPMPGGVGGIQVGTGPPPPGANMFNMPAFNAPGAQAQAAPGAANTQAANTNAAPVATQGPNATMFNALFGGAAADNDENDNDEWVNDVD